MKRTPAILLTLLAALCVAPAQAQSTMTAVGRLFFAPEMRVQLERQRQLKLQESRSLEAGTIRLDGIVVRSSGKSTVWVNNQATLITGNEAPADLKVGVTLDRATRETSGGLAAGEIRVRPGK